MKHLKSTLMAAAAVALVSGAAQADVTIATVGPMTGQYASFGEQMRRGAEQAVKDINARGGVNGQKVKLIVGDDACDPKQAVAVAKKLVSQGVVFVGGHFCSGSSIPASKVYTAGRILQISPASTNPKLTDEGGPNVFRVCGRDDQQGVVAGNYLVKNYAGTRIAFLHDKTAYGKGLMEATLMNYKKAGGKPSMVEAYTAGEKDYKALMSKDEGGRHPGVLPGRLPHRRRIDDQPGSWHGLQAAAHLRRRVGSPTSSGKIAGKAGEGVLMTFSPDPRKNPIAAPVVAKFKAQNYDPGRIHALHLWCDPGVGAGGDCCQVLQAGPGGEEAAQHAVQYRARQDRLRQERAT